MKRAPAKPIKLTPEQIQAIESEVFHAVEAQVKIQWNDRFYLLAVAFEKETAYWYLRIFMEGLQAPISLSDCELVSRALDPVMDELPILQDLSYSLEISSPGLFRPLKTQREFEFYRGRPVRIEEIDAEAVAKAKKSKKNEPIPAKKGPEGILEAFDAERGLLTLKRSADGSTVEVPLTAEKVIYLNPEIRFPEEGAEQAESSPTI